MIWSMTKWNSLYNTSLFVSLYCPSSPFVHTLSSCLNHSTKKQNRLKKDSWLRLYPFNDFAWASKAWTLSALLYLYLSVCFCVKALTLQNIEIQFQKIIVLTCACVKRTLRFLRCESGNCIADAAAEAAKAAALPLSLPQPSPDIWEAALIPEAPPRIKLETENEKMKKRINSGARFLYWNEIAQTSEICRRVFV